VTGSTKFLDGLYSVEYPGLSGSKEFNDENIAGLHARNWMSEHPEGNGEGAKTIDVLNKGEADGTRNS
jgi:hypothetical protein